MEPLLIVFADTLKNHPLVAVLLMLFGSPTVSFIGKIFNGYADHLNTKWYKNDHKSR